MLCSETDMLQGNVKLIMQGSQVKVEAAFQTQYEAGLVMAKVCAILC